MNPSPLKFAIIGCGHIAARHAEQIASKAVLSAVCDIIPEKAQQLAATYGATAYDNIETVFNHLPKLDAIVICTPNGLHADQSILALKQGFHVLCEKPMAINSADAELMIAAAHEAGRILYVVKQNRFNPPVIAVKELLDSGKLGRLLSIQVNCFWNRSAVYYHNTWKGTMALDGGSLYTQFSHFIDLMYWMAGDVEKVFAITKNELHRGLIEFEDQGSCILQFSNGVTGTLQFTLNAFAKNMEGSVTLFGEKGTVKIGGQYLNKLEYEEIENYKIGAVDESRQANDYGYYTGSMSNHDIVYDKFIEGINTGHSFHENLEASFKTVQIIDKIYKSASLNMGAAR